MPQVGTQNGTVCAGRRVASSAPPVKSHHRQEAKGSERLPLKSAGPGHLDPRDDVAAVVVGAGLRRRETQQEDHRLGPETAGELLVEVMGPRLGVPAIREEGDIPRRRANARFWACGGARASPATGSHPVRTEGRPRRCRTGRGRARHRHEPPPVLALRRLPRHSWKPAPEKGIPGAVVVATQRQARDRRMATP